MLNSDRVRDGAGEWGTVRTLAAVRVWRQSLAARSARVVTGVGTAGGVATGAAAGGPACGLASLSPAMPRSRPLSTEWLSLRHSAH